MAGNYNSTETRLSAPHEKGRTRAVQKSASGQRAGRLHHACVSLSVSNPKTLGLCHQESFCWFLVPTKSLFIIKKKKQREKWYRNQNNVSLLFCSCCFGENMNFKETIRLYVTHVKINNNHPFKITLWPVLTPNLDCSLVVVVNHDSQMLTAKRRFSWPVYYSFTDLVLIKPRSFPIDEMLK